MESTTTPVSASDFLSRYYAEEQKKKDALPSRALVLATQLVALGATTVEAKYDGCGDSGQIEEVNVMKEGQDISSSVNTELMNDLQDFFYTVLECRHGGWENNDGAFGEFTWTLADTLLPDAKPGQGLVHGHETRYTETFSDEHEGL